MSSSKNKETNTMDMAYINSIITPGAIILTRSKSVSSAIIQGGQASKWSHAFMCLDNGDIIETNGKKGIKIKPIGEALEGVSDADILSPQTPLDPVAVATLRKEAVLLANNPDKELLKYGKLSMFNSGLLPAIQAGGLAYTGVLAVGAIIGSAPVTAAGVATLGGMALLSKAAGKVDKLFGNREEMIDKMDRFYKRLGIRDSEFGKFLSANDQRLICSTIVQELAEFSDPELKAMFDEKSTNTRPSDISQITTKSGLYTSTKVKGSSKSILDSIKDFKPLEFLPKVKESIKSSSSKVLANLKVQATSTYINMYMENHDFSKMANEELDRVSSEIIISFDHRDLDNQAIKNIEFTNNNLQAHPPLGCDFQVGDIVTFTNDAGIVFNNNLVTGFNHSQPLRPVHTAGEAYWFGHREDSLKKADSYTFESDFSCEVPADYSKLFDDTLVNDFGVTDIQERVNLLGVWVDSRELKPEDFADRDATIDCCNLMREQNIRKHGM
jgi:hypothetical protein